MRVEGIESYLALQSLCCFGDGLFWAYYRERLVVPRGLAGVGCCVCGCLGVVGG